MAGSGRRRGGFAPRDRGLGRHRRAKKVFTTLGVKLCQKKKKKRWVLCCAGNYAKLRVFGAWGAALGSSSLPQKPLPFPSPSPKCSWVQDADLEQSRNLQHQVLFGEGGFGGCSFAPFPASLPSTPSLHPPSNITVQSSSFYLFPGNFRVSCQTRIKTPQWFDQRKPKSFPGRGKNLSSLLVRLLVEEAKKELIWPVASAEAAALCCKIAFLGFTLFFLLPEQGASLP